MHFKATAYLWWIRPLKINSFSVAIEIRQGFAQIVATRFVFAQTENYAKNEEKWLSVKYKGVPQIFVQILPTRHTDKHKTKILHNKKSINVLLKNYDKSMKREMNAVPIFPFQSVAYVFPIFPNYRFTFYIIVITFRYSTYGHFAI